MPNMGESILSVPGGISFWRGFITLYQSLPALWNTRADSYRNVEARKEGYKKLLAKLRDIDPTASMDQVKRKINSLRSAYRRELRKVQLSKKRGDSKYVYKTKLFYFEDMSFLNTVVDLNFNSNLQIDEEEFMDINSCSPVPHPSPSFVSRRGRSHHKPQKEKQKQQQEQQQQKPEQQEQEQQDALIEITKYERVSEEEQHAAPLFETVETDARSAAVEDEQEEEDFDDMEMTTSTRMSPVQRRNGVRRQRNTFSTTNISDANSSVAAVAHGGDEAQVLSTGWAALYRRLDIEQQLYATKVIMEALYQGALGRLHERSYKAIEHRGSPRQRARARRRGQRFVRNEVTEDELDSLLDMHEDNYDYL